ncbi:hypothetical protein RFI_35327 [Reticulomyxa filosa]|uniref:Uncharacterized protein n=1 Tax=Reticulomyxa filosa TaxID=46433 RepID=X6LL60_RETFI|nr:hypothetical protein RFI_35327 [Reticulomyxa filosa]|eukprot:ETO02111.1 hypothetical protein RFI_35327 [Reticulomyxa filosa]
MAIIAVSSVLDVKRQVLSDDQVQVLATLLCNVYYKYFAKKSSSNDVDVAMEDIQTKVVKQVFEPMKLEQLKEILFGALFKIGTANALLLSDTYVAVLWDRFQHGKSEDMLLQFMEAVVPVAVTDKQIFNIVLKHISIPLYQTMDSRGLQMLIGLCDTLCDNKKCAGYMSDETSQLWLDTWLFKSLQTIQKNEHDSKMESIVWTKNLRLAYVISRIIALTQDGMVTKIATQLLEKQDMFVKSFRQRTLFLAVVASLSPSVVKFFLERSKIELHWIETMQKQILSDDDSNKECTDVSMQCLAAIVNKSDTKTVINPLVNDYLIPTLKKMAESEWHSYKDLKYIIWLVKGLAMRCHDNCMVQICQYLCQLLRQDTEKFHTGQM